jgi:N-acetylglucosamine-6-phosphate deacetylase
MRLGVKAALVGGALVDGDVEVEDGLVRAVGVSPAGRGGTAVPGFVDLHVNGAAGVDFLTAGAEGWRLAAAALTATGVVAFQPTLVSSPPDAYAGPLAVAAELSDEPPQVLGVHLEGPFLSPEWPGAHRPEHLLGPNLELAERLIALGPVTTVTLAPELPGGLELTEALASRGVVVSCGHCDADAALAHAAFDRGARAVTHIHNAQRRWRPRDPGVAGAALVRAEVTVQAIADGVHLAPETVRAAQLAAGERFCLVTDAVAAAAGGPEECELGGRRVRVMDGAARLEDGTLAGRVLPMDQGVRNLVSWGATLAEAVHAASTAPARLLGRRDLGRLEPGAPANLTVLDDSLEVVRTLGRGPLA